MLKLRPNCEHCDRDLPPDAKEAMICSFECTFCRGCVETVLFNVCPNCGGGFQPRPVRPARDWVSGASLVHAPASIGRVRRPVDRESQRKLVERVGDRAPEER